MPQLSILYTCLVIIHPPIVGKVGWLKSELLGQKFIEITGSKSKIIFEPLPQDDPRQRKPDITLANQKLNGWKPEIKLDEGLGYTVDYFRKLI